MRSGKLHWSFHTIPRPGEFGYDTWPKEAWKTSGAANNWTGMTLDGKRGIVYVPTGSAAFDFYGSDRHGDNLFANTVLALDAARHAAAARVVRHQHEVAAGERDEGRQRRALVAALFLLDLHQQRVALADRVLDARAAHVGAFAGVVAGRKPWRSSP